MKNILTKVATATLFTGLALSSATAASILCIDGNTSNLKNDVNVTIDLKGQGAEVNLTLVPAAVYQGASFKLKFENGGLSEDATHLLCVGDTKVGGLQEPGSITNGVMTEPTFSFIDNDDVAALIQKDSNITIETTSDCSGEANTSELLSVIGLADKPCEAITATIVDPFSTQGQPIPSLVTAKSVSLGTTKTFIKVACTPPQCFVTTDQLKFVDSAKAPGVNVALTPVDPTSTGILANHTSLSTAACPDCGDKPVILDCTTTIIISNANDFAIKGLDLVANFNNGEAVDNASFKPEIDVTIDGNQTKKYVLGAKFSPTDLNISAGHDGNITLHFTPNGTDLIAIGSIVANITGLDSNLSSANDINPVFTDKKLANIQIGAQTQFTVPYMSAAGASQANFVKVSTLAGADATTLAATISDADGNSCNVTLTDVPKNGGSTFVFASKLPTGSAYQPLIPTGECSNLTSDLFSVKFTAGASVNAVGYMRTKRGERTIEIF